MKKLLIAYEFETPYQYYSMTAESYVNGQKIQAQEQFKVMPKKNQKEMLSHILFDNNIYVGDSWKDKKYFFDLL